MEIEVRKEVEHQDEDIKKEMDVTQVFLARSVLRF